MIRKIAVIWVLVLCSFMLLSCGVDDIDTNSFKDDEIVISGLSENDQTITVEKLSELKCTTKKTQSTSDKIGTVKATGPLLETLVESYGSSIEDFSKVIIYGEDDYDIKLDKDFLKENQVILAFGIDGEPIKEDARPVRIIIPDSDSAYWVRMVNKIEFVE